MTFYTVPATPQHHIHSCSPTVLPTVSPCYTGNHSIAHLTVIWER